VELERPCMEPYSVSGPDDIFQRDEAGDIPEEFADDTEPLYVGNEIYTINEYQYQSRGFNFFSMYEPSNSEEVGPAAWGAIFYNSKNRCPVVSDDGLYFDENFQDIGSPGDVYLAEVYTESGVMEILDQARETYVENAVDSAGGLEGYESYNPTGNMETYPLKFFTRSAISFKQECEPQDGYLQASGGGRGGDQGEGAEPETGRESISWSFLRASEAPLNRARAAAWSWQTGYICLTVAGVGLATP